MKISGFTFVKNADKFYYPIRACIESLLPLVDEFIVALGNCDADDNTRREIDKINSPKVKIIETVWDTVAYPRGTEHAHQTDIAKRACTGDWLFYLQGDEVIHEQYLPIVRQACRKYLTDTAVEGFLFNYRHFWGDYAHYISSHGWYPREIRLIRNLPDIHSYISAQSFRRIPDFDGKSYRQRAGTHKLNVAYIPAYIYHYGWVRPPQYMQTKKKAFASIHRGTERASQEYENAPKEFDYGALGRLGKFTGTHPAVMQAWIAKFDWADKLNYSETRHPDQIPHKHEKWKYRLLTFIEQKVLGFKNYEFGYNNWKVIRHDK
jgi:hypothetical protein